MRFVLLPSKFQICDQLHCPCCNFVKMLRLLAEKMKACLGGYGLDLSSSSVVGVSWLTSFAPSTTLKKKTIRKLRRFVREFVYLLSFLIFRRMFVRLSFMFLATLNGNPFPFLLKIPPSSVLISTNYCYWLVYELGSFTNWYQSQRFLDSVALNLSQNG